MGGGDLFLWMNRLSEKKRIMGENKKRKEKENRGEKKNKDEEKGPVYTCHRAKARSYNNIVPDGTKQYEYFALAMQNLHSDV